MKPVLVIQCPVSRVQCHESTFVRLTTTGSLLLLVACLVLVRSVRSARKYMYESAAAADEVLLDEGGCAGSRLFHDFSACVSEECT